MKISITITLFFCFLSTMKSQEVKEMNFEELSPYLHMQTDTVYVVNFWATWCKPCVEELPHFLDLAAGFSKQKVKFVFVSLDFPKQKESRLLPFIEKNGVDEEVILLNDPNSNKWINLVDESWTGGIPATIVYKKNNRKFHEGQLSYEELKSFIESRL